MGKCTLLRVFIGISLIYKTAYGFDPCSSPSLIKDAEYRGTNCLPNGSFLCDRGSFKSGWYTSKLKGSYGMMPEVCPARAACGTLQPVWMKGVHPNEADGIVKRQVCYRGLMDKDCCRENVTIEVKNCGTFFVYNLPETRICDVAYCFGNESCPLSSTTAAPTVSNPSDPCNIAVSLSDVKHRGENCMSHELNTPLCDRVLPLQWYKVDIFGIPLDMSQTCVPPGSCGTLGPIWLNGSLPSFNDGVVSRRACRRGFADKKCCVKTYDIEIRNCITHNVYRLPFTELCPESYCFGKQPCLIDKTTKTSEPRPTESKNVILYVIIAGLMFLLLVAIVVIYLIVRNKKKTMRGSKVNVQTSDVVFSTEKVPPPPYTMAVKSN